ncbi:MAG: site-specific DNA-methyltransferase [Clostridiales bacterium]|jgi:adenine-specific DNA-methyltransferase|nr:site-specific DNA-methyltransferase [Clostridiales bacterium]
MKLDGLSMDLEKANMEKLRSVFPECFSENKLDIDKLLSLCGEYIDNDFEKYKFEWHGKAESLRLAQKRSTGTLRPCPEESVNFDTTQNLYIEGDNLEVLKLLQTSYYRKVKMIYIDPPYNTGNDFVYEDDFADPMARYKEVTQQTTKSNPETMGRYHTNWLNMMYPRLRLAANLLRDDGVIFISIDDNEVTNLRKLCDEVFGEENFVGTFTWQSKKGGGSDNNTVVRDQEYVLCYGKSIISGDFFNRIILEAEPLDCEDEHGQFRRGRELNKWGSNSRREDRPTMFFPIPGPNGEDVYPIRNDGTEGCWRWGKENMLSAVKNGDVEFSLRDDGTYIVYEKIRTTEPRLKPYRTMLENVGATADGSKLIKAIFDDLKIFDFPKPIDLIKKLLEMGSSDNDIILDFFSGSATTAHAVMQLNAEDGGSRKFICVQFPELCDEKSEAYKAGYRNICEIGKERIRRAGAKIISNKEQVTGNSETIGEDKTVNCNLLPVNSPDVGFKVFKLDTSNIKLWDGTPVAEEDIQIMLDRMNDMIDSIKNDRTDMDVVYEIMLKMGVPLTYPVKKVIVNKEQLTGNSEMIDKNKTVNCNLLPVISTVTCYSVGEDNLLMICLDAGITTETIEQLADYAPAKIVIAESCFADVSAMRNAHYVLRDRKIELKLV